MTDPQTFPANDYQKGAQLVLTRKLAPLGFSKGLHLFVKNAEGQILIIQDDNGDFLPFNERQAGEQTGDQAARCAYEEAKILIKNMDQLGYIKYQEKGKECYHSFIVAELDTEEDSSLNYGFIEKDELKDLLNDPITIKIINQIA